MSDRRPLTLTTGPGLEPDDLGPPARPSAAGLPRQHRFDASILYQTDLEIALAVLQPSVGLPVGDMDFFARARLSLPDAVVSTDDGDPIMYRWHLVPRNDFGNVYFHIQVRDDSPERGPHDHQYDSQATLLAGYYWDHTFRRIPRGYLCDVEPGKPRPHHIRTYAPAFYLTGDVVRRKADQLHMIKLGDGCPYTMTIFATGPRYRDWGFCDPDGTWHPASAKGDLVNGVVVAKGRTAT